MNANNTLWVTVIVLLVVAGGTTLATDVRTASAFIYDVGKADDIGISPTEEQVISGVEVYSDSNPIVVNVDQLINLGAKLDANSSSYSIRNDQSVITDGVYIDNPDSSSPRIIVNASSIPSTGTYDILIDNINTTAVSLDSTSESKLNKSVTYSLEQGGYFVTTSFTISSGSTVDIAGYDALSNTVHLQNISV